MIASSTSAYFLTNAIHPQVAVTFTPQFNPNLETMEVIVSLIQGGPSDTPVASSTEPLSSMQQNVGLTGGNFVLNGFIWLDNNIIYFDGGFSAPGVAANLNGPVGGFFHQNPGSETLTTPMNISAGERTDSLGLSLQAIVGNGPLEVSYNFDGTTGTIPLTNNNSGTVSVNQGDIAISGEASFAQNSFQFTGAFIKADVVQIGFSNGIFACMATSGS